ncbi:MAG TPA: hypothetical protein VJ837_01115, partial [Candidatus Paceibacterota bacterium]|nr:hypothetical protein [Candidatus Paceibacterota bacterium]
GTADPVRVTTPENTNVVGGVTAGIVPQADQANGNVSQMNEVCGDSAGINVNGSEVNVNGADPTEGILSLAVYIYDESTDQAPTLIANTKDFNGAGTIGTNSSAVANNAVAQPVCSTCHDARVTSASG